MEKPSTYKSKVCDLIVANARELVHKKIDLISKHAEITKKLETPDISHRDFVELSSRASEMHEEIERLSLQEDVWNCVLKICTEVEE